MAKISVIVPIYNSSKTIARCIESLLTQTFSDLEIILVNDGSNDSSLSVIKRYAANDARVIVLDKPNGGVSSARNAGLERATGEYIAFVDADDEALPELYESLAEKAEKENADMTFCRFIKKQADKETYPKEPLYLLKDKKMLPFFFSHPKITIMGSVWRILFKSSLAKQFRFDESVYIAEDLLFVLSCLNEAKTIALVDKFLYRYNAPSSLTIKYFKNDYIEQNKNLCLKFLSLLEKNQETICIRKQLFNTYTLCVCQTIRNVQQCKPILKTLMQDEFFKNAKKFRNYLSALRYSSMKEKIRYTLVYAKQFALLRQVLS